MQTSNTFSLRNTLLHVAIWLALLSTPSLILIENQNDGIKYCCHVWVMLIGLIITFYGNFLWGIDKLFYKKRYVAFIVFNVILFIVVMNVRLQLSELTNQLLHIERHHTPSRGLRHLFLYNDIIFYMLGVGASFGIRYAVHLRNSERMREQMEKEHLSSELAMLKYQIQPHFFFNTLNNIYALIGKSPSDAQKAVHRLSKLMRYVLYDNGQATTSLRNEIDFVLNYSSLMQMRLGGQTTFTMEDPTNADEARIPPLLLIPLIENAFKHGVHASHDSVIECDIKAENGRIRFKVTNDNAEPSNSKKEDRSHSGIGLTNLRKRLEIIYGNDFTLDAHPSPDNKKFIAALNIPTTQNT